MLKRIGNSILREAIRSGGLLLAVSFGMFALLTLAPGDPVLPYTTAADRERMSLQVQAYNEVMQTLAAQFGVGVVDFYNTDIFTNPETVYADGIHPNPQGYELIAELWLEAILKLLP